MMPVGKAAIRSLGRPNHLQWRRLTTMSTTISSQGRQQSIAVSPLLSKTHLSLGRAAASSTMNTTIIDHPHHRWFSTTEEKTTAAAEEDATNETDAADPAAAAATEEEESAAPSFEEQLATLEEQVKNLKDQLLRSLAEQENTRTIARRDVSSAKNYAIKSFAKSLLEVSDNLHRALDSVPKDDQSENLRTLYEGVQMTNDGLTKALQSNGIQAYCLEPGDVFDPTKHEALMEYADPSKEPGTVGQVIKVGFMLNDRVLRPAEVGVIKK